MSNLVIVESPAKAKTIQKYLGKDFEVIASMGHIRDLPKSKLGFDEKNNFIPEYVDIQGKDELIKKLKLSAKKSDYVYLATDPDREGEAISWHLANVLGLDLSDNNRVTFNEITQMGINTGMSSPRMIDMDLVNAQQARRLLDRIVGYKISPFLWKKIKKGLSAGRVQSVAVKLIVDREEKIRSFIPEEFWSISAILEKSKGHKKAFEAKFYGIDNKKTLIKDENQAKKIIDEIKNSEFIVTDIKKGIRKKSPQPPFTTSTLQQDANRRLNFQAKKVMKVAQELYEGIDIDGLGAVGLITYMRTDSLRLSNEAIEQATNYIKQTFGNDYVPTKAKVYKSGKNSQDAHEAIRPTMVELTPEKVKPNLTNDQFKLYKLIWERFVACQMSNALQDTISVEIKANNTLFKCSGCRLKFDGFTAVYNYTTSEEEQEITIPELEIGEILLLNDIIPNQHFTQPPARYTEASLIKELEENGIGRPSTYATTITTIQQRGYIEREQKSLKPTDLGEITTKLMKEQFKDIVDVKFTADMENKLDMVEEGNLEWQSLISSFYYDFEDKLSIATENMKNIKMKIPDKETDEICELCGRKMVIKHGRFGEFLACPGFPECRNTRKLVQPTKGNCPICGKACVPHKTKKGRVFYGCQGYPECKFMTWFIPSDDKCPQCGSSLFVNSNKKLICLKDNCGFEKLIIKKADMNDE